MASQADRSQARLQLGRQQDIKATIEAMHTLSTSFFAGATQPWAPPSLFSYNTLTNESSVAADEHGNLHIVTSGMVFICGIDFINVQKRLSKTITELMSPFKQAITTAS